jgi:hypothetical protein
VEWEFCCQYADLSAVCFLQMSRMHHFRWHDCPQHDHDAFFRAYDRALPGSVLRAFYVVLLQGA